jgi:hypothetical protein
VSKFRRVARVAWLVVSTLCTVYVTWVLCGTSFVSRICDQPGAYSLVTNDQVADRKVKATVFTTDCGAMSATRTVVNFSSALVDGRSVGDTVVVLTDVPCGNVRCEWRTNREFVVRYPHSAGVEFAVSKTRGVSISLEPE